MAKSQHSKQIAELSKVLENCEAKLAILEAEFPLASTHFLTYARRHCENARINLSYLFEDD